MTANKILFVENESDWQLRIREYFEGMGYVVVPASNEFEAREKFLAHRREYILILLDISLEQDGTDQKGLTLLSQLRELGVTTPCVPLTGNLDKKRALALVNTYNVDGLLEKTHFSEKDPSGPEYIRTVLHRAIQKNNKLPKNSLYVWLILLSTVLGMAIFSTILIWISNRDASEIEMGLIVFVGIVIFYVINYWIATYTGVLEGNVVAEMGRDILEKINPISTIKNR